MKTETVFKKGQKVFDHHFGWGEVEDILGEEDFPIRVCFEEEQESYTNAGRLYGEYRPTLSFTEYTLEGFSQEPTIDYNECIGKLGMFWGDYPYKMIGILKSFDLEKEYAFYLEEWGMFKNFQPLTEEQIKILGL